MGITTIKKNLDGSDLDPARNPNMVSKGLGICPTGIECCIVVVQDCFGVSHNVFKGRTGKKF